MAKQSKHIKRRAMPKRWPLAKKGTKYVMKPQPGKNIELSLPLGIVLRDILKLVKTSKELKKILTAKEILVNNNVIKSIAFPISLFDIILIKKINKYFRLEISENKKLTAKEINEKDSIQKPYKVIGKKILKKGKAQLNLYDGRNFLVSKEDMKKIKVNDSIIVDLKNNKIVKHIPLKQDVFVLVVKGKHAGNKGSIMEIEKGLVTIKTPEKQIKTIIENIFITKEK